MKNFTIILLAFHRYSLFLKSSETNHQECKLLWKSLPNLEKFFSPFYNSNIDARNYFYTTKITIKI